MCKSLCHFFAHKMHYFTKNDILKRTILHVFTFPKCTILPAFWSFFELFYPCAAGVEGLAVVVDEEVAIDDGFTIWAFTIYHLGVGDGLRYAEVITYTIGRLVIGSLL